MSSPFLRGWTNQSQGLLQPPLSCIQSDDAAAEMFLAPIFKRLQLYITMQPGSSHPSLTAACRKDRSGLKTRCSGEPASQAVHARNLLHHQHQSIKQHRKSAATLDQHSCFSPDDLVWYSKSGRGWEGLLTLGIGDVSCLLSDWSMPQNQQCFARMGLWRV
jgi:hypothetical protein